MNALSFSNETFSSPFSYESVLPDSGDCSELFILLDLVRFSLAQSNSWISVSCFVRVHIIPTDTWDNHDGLLTFHVWHLSFTFSVRLNCAKHLVRSHRLTNRPQFMQSLYNVLTRKGGTFAARFSEWSYFPKLRVYSNWQTRFDGTFALINYVNIFLSDPVSRQASPDYIFILVTHKVQLV